jgi:hypothetical protein
MKFKKIFFGAIGLGLIGAFIALYMYNKPHANYEKLKPEYSLICDVLVADFEKDEKAANAKYLNKMLLVNGIIAHISGNEAGEITVALNDPMFGVTCSFNSQQSDQQAGLIKQLKVGNEVKIKGRCDGLLTDVRLTQCSVVE